jgi:hypothetical protein
MIESDTIKLLRECDAGVKMGVESINEVYDYASSPKLRAALNKCKDQHIGLTREIEKRLIEFRDDGKEPNPIAKSMSKMKTEVKLRFSESDSTIANLMTDGCNMGIKALNKYLNEYKAADDVSKDITKKLIKIEETLAHEVREFL